MTDRGSFSWALGCLKGGISVTRGAWSGTGQSLLLQKPNSSSKMTIPYFCIRLFSGGFVPWVPSHLDLMAEDWEIAKR